MANRRTAACVLAYATSISLRSTTSAFSVYPYISSNTRTALDGPTQKIPFTTTNINMSTPSEAAADVAVDIASNIASVKQRMDDAISSNDRPSGSVRLVAVSKTKPLELLEAAYEVRILYTSCYYRVCLYKYTRVHDKHVFYQ